MPTATNTTRLDLDALLRLASIDEHPLVHSAHAGVVTAQQAVEAAERRHAEAQAERHDAEQAASQGYRDDKRLRRAQEQLDAAESDLRIATHTLTRANESASDTYDDVCRDVDTDIRAHHHAALVELDRALAEAKRCSDAAARIEDSSRTLLGGGYYRKRPGSALPDDGSWRKEFGTGTGGETRYAYWRKCWRLS